MYSAILCHLTIASCLHLIEQVVFTTGMVGYPEALTDPSYQGQVSDYSANYKKLVANVYNFHIVSKLKNNTSLNNTCTMNTISINQTFFNR